MSDLISRQAAIDLLDEISREVDDGYGFDYAKWREYFCELPPALGTNLAEVGADCISREKAIDAIGEKSDEIYKTKQKGATYPHDDFFQGMAYAENVVRQLPPIQSEIIRCKDCKYARLTDDGSCKYCDIWFPDEAEYMDGDYYCASAERKSNG